MDPSRETPVRTHLAVWLRSQHVPLLLVLAVSLLPFGNGAQIPLAILALIGIYRLIQDPAAIWSAPVARLLTVVFLLLWVPLLLALLNAVHLERALPSTARFGAFFFAAIAVLHHARGQDTAAFLYPVVFGVLTLWVVDALFQSLTGFNLLGYPQVGDQINGIFDSKIRLGIVLAHLAPFYFESVRRFAGRRPLLWLLVVPYCIVILLAGTRMGWFTLLLALLAYAAYLIVVYRVNSRHLLFFAVLLTAFGIVALNLHSGLQSRWDKTLAVVSEESFAADRAMAERAAAWRASLVLIRDDAWFGVGIRGFETAALDRGYLSTPLAHPHLFILDVGTSAGLVGVAGFLAALWLLVRFYARLESAARRELFAPWLAVGLALFPFNAHWSLYATYASLLIWVVILSALALTSACTRPQAETSGGNVQGWP